ncbi:MAG: DUF3794 domain-containing protein [Ruminococcus sp.]|nr:DUF3794 domain-containing protein [Ruminococcus sp.]MCM1154519.1 DUF3794 domain-containing protein [Roseburia sp.]
MELVKKKIHMDRIANKAGTQMVLEEDVNISDNRPDASHLISVKGDVIMDEIRVNDDRVSLKGRLQVQVLYLTEEEGMCAGMEAQLPFEEKVNMEGVHNGDSIIPSWTIEDLTVGLINSRKMSVQAMISFTLEMEEKIEQEAAVDIYHEEPVEYRKQVYPLLQMAVNKKDIFRIKEEMELPSNMPNAFQLIWSSITLNKVEFKALDGKIALQGEMKAFFLYEGEGDNDRTLWYENTVPFSGMIECHGCMENMIPDIRYTTSQCSVEIKPDFDGEERVFCVENVLDLEIRLYEEENLEVLSDIYGVDKEIEAVSAEVALKRLLLHGSGKCKIAEHARIQDTEMHMYQLLHNEGEIRIEEQAVMENGISVTGTLQVTTIYLCTNGQNTLYATKSVLPFTHFIDVPDMEENCDCHIYWSLEQLIVTMLDSEELDIKAVLDFDALLFTTRKTNLITDIKVEELDMNKISELPGIVIYIAGNGDTLWDIGKKYYVPIAQLKEVNELVSEEIRAGDKILVVKGTA